MRRPTNAITLGLLFVSLGLAGSHAVADEVVFARHLSLSPDGQTLAFSWAGDIWTVPTAGGNATRLTVHPGYDGQPLWSDDGQRIAFASRRHGAADIFVMKRNGDELRRLTFGDRSIYASDWIDDDTQLLLYSRREGQSNWGCYCYTLPVAGGQYWRLMDCFGRDARQSPDGRHLAFTRGGGYWKWWRRGYRGSGNEDIWLRDLDTGDFRQLTDFNGNDRLPAWDAEGRGVYHLSDRSGTFNVWYQPLGGDARAITNMSVDDVRDYAISADGKTLAFTHWDKLYVQSLPNGQPREIHVTAASDSILNDLDWKTLRDGADEAEVSSDAKELALVVRGEIFV
ncbi:MAG: PD40 domain-containing protein, partial [Phycisphaerae bacterium]|nr:PD40 domain-containing protein [Phycisphaerae bacterium]